MIRRSCVVVCLSPAVFVGGGGVVCARWCPALPRPGGRSTIGAGGLSFRVRDGSGRCLPAMTTETCGGVCGARVALWCCGWLWSSGPPRRVFFVRGWGWVGGGLHSGRGFVLGAGSPPLWCGGCGVPPFVRPPPFPWCVWGGGGVCLCWPVSTSRLRPLPVFHVWPIDPVVCWGPSSSTGCCCGDLVLKVVSRLDAFSGYPVRT